MDPWKKECEFLRGLSLRTKIKRSLGYLKQAIAEKDPNTPLIVNFSGGKDSCAILTLARMAGARVEALYVDAGFDVPITRPYVEEQAAKLNVKLHVVESQNLPLSRRNPEMENIRHFLDYVRYYGYWPTCGNRWCSIWTKQRAMKTYLRREFGNIRLYKLNGVRMFESQTRLWKYGNPKYANEFIYKGRKHMRPDREHRPCILVYPIIEWTSENVVEFLQDKGFEIHKGYKLFGVSGCKWCPVHQPDVYLKIMSKYPNLYDDFIKVEREIVRPCVRGDIWLKDLKNLARRGVTELTEEQISKLKKR